MDRYLVWDILNQQEQDAQFTTVAWSPYDAAIAFAKSDIDGQNDGCYRELPYESDLRSLGHCVAVREQRTRLLWYFNVGIERFDPVYHAVDVTSTTNKE